MLFGGAKKLKEKISASGSHKLSIKLGIPVNVPRTSFVEIIQRKLCKIRNFFPIALRRLYFRRI